MIEIEKLQTLIKLWRDNAEFLQCTHVTSEADDMASVYNGCARTLEIYLEEVDKEEFETTILDETTTLNTNRYTW